MLSVHVHVLDSLSLCALSALRACVPVCVRAGVPVCVSACVCRSLALPCACACVRPYVCVGRPARCMA